MITKKRTQKLKRYALQFCEQVRADFPQIPLTSKNPTVKCFRAIGCTSDAVQLLQGIAEQRDNGDFIIDGFHDQQGGVIDIFNIIKETPAELKRTVRHECIHFLLYESGLPCEDDANIFIALALNYDARPYGLLKRQDLLESLQKGGKA